MPTEWEQFAASAVSIVVRRLKAWTPRVKGRKHTRKTVIEVTRTTRTTRTETTVES